MVIVHGSTQTRLRFAAGALLAATLTASSALAEDALLKVKERAKYLDDYRSLLTHSDASIRLAAVEEAFKGKDTVLRGMAMEAALGSDDERLQTAALRHLLQSNRNLAVNVVLPDGSEPAQEYLHGIFHGLVLEGIAVSESDEILMEKPKSFETGQLVRGGFNVNFDNFYDWYDCVMEVRIATATLLTGSLDCTFPDGKPREKAGAPRASLPVRVPLP